MISKKLENTGVKSSIEMLSLLLLGMPQNLMEESSDADTNRTWIWSVEKKPNGSIEIEWRDENSDKFLVLEMFHVGDTTFLIDISSKDRDAQNKVYSIIKEVCGDNVVESRNSPHLMTISQMIVDELCPEGCSVNKQEDKHVITTENFKITVEYCSQLPRPEGRGLK